MPRPSLATVHDTDRPLDAKSGPTVGLRRCDPPVKTRRHGLAEQISALVPQLEADPGEWFQVAAWPGKSSGAAMAKRMKDAHPGIEWRGAVTPSGSGLWARAPE
jgi:hypothetical protein